MPDHDGALSSSSSEAGEIPLKQSKRKKLLGLLSGIRPDTSKVDA